ncbi:MAG: DUF885 domain-containing protein [Actinomyces sp.]|nr:DUF885 domain-containing protein [Actinomyces sp.]MCI1663084.1 DUF885 domain-containing protein [Actinomyces sp.]
MNTQSTRVPSALDHSADDYVLTVARINPIAATDWGLPGTPGALPDYSPDGWARQLDLDRALVADALRAQARPRDDVDRVTASAIVEGLGAQIGVSEAGEDLAAVNNIASPIQEVRDSFDLMPRETAEDWQAVADRLHAVPHALAGYEESLRLAASRGLVAARRQILIGIEESRDLADPAGALASLAEEGTANPAVRDVPGLSKALREGARAAGAAYGRLAGALESDLLGRAPEQDGVGRERYERFSRLFTGAVVDLDETYEWGLDQLARIDSEQRAIAAELYGPGTTVREAMTRLNDEPELQLHGTAALQQWMQGLADSVVADLDGTHFDIPAPAHRIECLLAPSHNGGIYYTAPSQDFSRPGRMWWSVPEGETVFHTWQERTTVFHEGVPGHHLQISQALAEAGSLNLYRRMASWNSGHGEGWALYAEGLMAELGYQDAPANRMGLLDSMRLRAARVALDIGVHLGKDRPGGGGIWDRDFAWRFLKENVAMADGFLSFELNRYLGWPGQAPSYKVGQRLWTQMREDYLATASSRGEEASLRAFHSKALRLGSLPMATLREAVLS